MRSQTVIYGFSTSETPPPFLAISWDLGVAPFYDRRAFPRDPQRPGRSVMSSDIGWPGRNVFFRIPTSIWRFATSNKRPQFLAVAGAMGRTPCFVVVCCLEIRNYRSAPAISIDIGGPTSETPRRFLRYRGGNFRNALSISFGIGGIGLSWAIFTRAPIVGR